MNRRTFLYASIGVLATPLAAEAQQPKTIVRIGFLSSSSAERERPRLTAFQQTLREMGYFEGQSIVIEQRYAGGNFQQLPELAAELARGKVDIFVVAGHLRPAHQEGDRCHSHRHGGRCRSCWARSRREPGATRRKHHRPVGLQRGRSGETA
jgi:hypothetical protein